MYKIEDITNKILQGNALDELKKFPDECIDMCVTSNPYWNMRNYSDKTNIIWDGDENCNHDWGNIIKFKGHPPHHGEDSTFMKISTVTKDVKTKSYNSEKFCKKCGAWYGQLGLEPDFNLFIKHLCDIYDQVYRVLKKEGSLYVNISDTYSGNKIGNTSNINSVFMKEANKNINKNCYLPNKSLCMIPERFAIEMINRDWILRNIIIWHKKSCLPESVADRFTRDYEYIYFFTKQQKYYFEQQFEPYSNETIPRMFRGVSNNHKWLNGPDGQSSHTMSQPRENINQKADGSIMINPNGRNKRTVWTINNKPFKDAHFAVFPLELIETPILASCPEFICTKCGKPRKKIYEKKVEFHSGSGKAGNVPSGKWKEGQQENSGEYDIRMGPKINKKDKGYTDCECHSEFKQGIVLDCFSGAGTSAVASKQLGRNFVGIELNSDYIEIAEKRLGLIPKKFM